jgi:hypothetical protein
MTTVAVIPTTTISPAHAAPNQPNRIGMLRTEGSELLGRAAVLQRTAGVHVGQDHRLLGREDLGRLRHEAHATEGDHVRVGRLRLAAEIEAVSDKVRDILDLGLLVIMRQDHRVALLAQAIDFGADVDALEVLRLVHDAADRDQPGGGKGG